MLPVQTSDLRPDDFCDVLLTYGVRGSMTCKARVIEITLLGEPGPDQAQYVEAASPGIVIDLATIAEHRGVLHYHEHGDVESLNVRIGFERIYLVLGDWSCSAPA